MNKDDLVYKMALDFPRVTDFLAEIIDNRKLKVTGIEIDKDPRENINISLQFDFKGYNCEISPNFIKYSGLLGEREFEVSPIDNSIEPIFKVAWGNKGDYSIGDLLSGGVLVKTITKTTPSSDVGYILLELESELTNDIAKDFFLTEKIGDYWKIIVKIDTETVGSGITTKYISILY